MSCARSPPRTADAGDERQSARPGMRQRRATSSHLELSCRAPGARWRASWDRCLLPTRYGWLRRNAVSPHGVRLSGAPGAPLRIGCSSANRALAGKLQWDGIVAVPEVFDAGCSAPFRYEGCGLPGGSARSWDADERYGRPDAFRLISLACGHTATHGGTHSVAALADIWPPIRAARTQLRPRGAAIAGRRAWRALPGGREPWKDH